MLYGPDDISVGNRLNNLAEAYRNVKEYNKALELFKESLRIKRIKYPEGNEKSVANTLNNIGMTYLNLKKHQDATENYEEALKIYIDLMSSGQDQKESKSSIASISSSLGDCYNAMG